MAVRLSALRSGRALATRKVRSTHAPSVHEPEELGQGSHGLCPSRASHGPSSPPTDAPHVPLNDADSSGAAYGLQGGPVCHLT
jgi:hypothetical protein